MYYHVAHESFAAGEKLYCLDEFEAEFGTDVLPWKWDDWSREDYKDGDGVSLFESREDAEEFQSEFGGIILQVDATEEDRIVRNSEGFRFWLGSIPADRITILS